MTQHITIARKGGTKPLLSVRVAQRQRAPKYKSAARGVRSILSALRRAFPRDTFRVEVR